MKKLSYLLGLFIVAGLLFSSCSDDEESLDPPNLSFLGGTTPDGYERIDSDVTVTAGDTIVFGFTASKVSDKDIRNVIVERKQSGATPNRILDSVVSVASFTMDILTIAHPTVTEEDFIITVWDKADKNSSISFTVTTEPVPSNITVYNDKILGAQASVTGSSFASSDGTIYSLADAMANSAEIDWMYFYGATNFATLAAPDDPAAATVFNNPQNGLQNWATKNATRFHTTTITSANFDAINSSVALVAAATQANPPPDQTKINDLSVNDVISFKTFDEKYGLIRIDNIATGDTGTIDITVKIQ